MRIHRDRLIRRLFDSQKIPPDYVGRFSNIGIPDADSGPGVDLPGVHTIVVMPSVGQGIHRVYLDCPRCRRLIPIGRVGQHGKACH